jgi:RNA polymerase-binding transcription factor
MVKKRAVPTKVRSSGSDSGGSGDWVTKQKERLEKEREHLRREIASRADQLKVFGTPDPREDADIAEETWEDEEVTRTVDVLQERFRQVEVALERINGGSYGKCVDCKQTIPRQRLDAVPSATRCVSCQEKLEAKTERPPEAH